MSEFQSDIKDKQYDEDGNELDKHGFKVQTYPSGAEAVKVAVLNCEQLCGLKKTEMEAIAKGIFTDSTTLDHTGRTSDKITIEYNIKEKE